MVDVSCAVSFAFRTAICDSFFFAGYTDIPVNNHSTGHARLSKKQPQTIKCSLGLIVEVTDHEKIYLFVTATVYKFTVSIGITPILAVSRTRVQTPPTSLSRRDGLQSWVASVGHQGGVETCGKPGWIRRKHHF